MKRLLRVSLDILVTSIIPIISWFLLGTILDRNLINIFSLTYPIQCLMGIIISIFGIGANICIYKDKNKNAADNGIFYGIVFSIIIFGFILYNIDKYIMFMNMDVAIYKTFGAYSIIQIFLHTILHLVLSKLYYKEENKKANKITILFNFVNFVSLISIAIITRNQMITSVVTLIIISILDIVILVRNLDKIDFKLNFMNCFKYNSVSFSVSCMFFVIYLVGFSSSFEYGTDYILAITFATLVTDTQWDIDEAIKTVAKVDIAKKKFVYKEHLTNAIRLNLLLVISVLIMSAILYPFYKPNLTIAGIFIFLHILVFLAEPFMAIKTCYLQLEDSPLKMTTNIIIAYLIRTAMSFIATPYCTIIGQICGGTYELICTKINYRKYEKKEDKIFKFA